MATPQATRGGKSLFKDVVEIAAAYLFDLCRNRPFLDGNKRTAFGACLVFLLLNGREPEPDSDAWEALIVGVASDALTREQVTKGLLKLVRS